MGFKNIRNFLCFFQSYISKSSSDILSEIILPKQSIISHQKTSYGSLKTSSLSQISSSNLNKKRKLDDDEDKEETRKKKIINPDFIRAQQVLGKADIAFPSNVQMLDDDESEGKKSNDVVMKEKDKVTTSEPKKKK